MKQFSKVFHDDYFATASVDRQLNDFLEAHPNYQVANVVLDRSRGSYLFVVFNVEDNISV